ncbi:alpha/beta hydrolase [Salinirussus salinus]|uniref:alpha/beta hydrolase n=1 Tax=Salinirussus salinus TaxID=1198300 RepID=UPI00135B1E0A|nr:alpha/beta hydrolase [Salinirussus salinus]
MDPTAADEPHPDVQDVLAEIEEFGVLPLNQYGAEGAREVYSELQPDVDGPGVSEVEDRTVPGYDGGPEVPVRIYRPEGEGPFPTVVFYHGGGFVIGDLESHDITCRYLANETGSVVVAVDYRLAPEHPFPAAVEDCYAATVWAAGAEDLDGDGNLAVMGDSAGGNLAAAVSLMARDLDGPDIDRQVLVYPATSRSDDWPSMTKFGEGYFLQAEDMDWFHDSYVPNEVHEANPYANPLEAADLSGLPPATVITAGFDPLRDQGAAYAEALAEAGVGVEYRNYEEMIHGFFTMLEGMAELDDAHAALGGVAEDLDDSFE